MDNLQAHWGPISGSACCVVAEARIEAGEIEPVIGQVIYGMFEGARQKLPLQVNGEKPQAGVDVFELDLCFGSRQDAVY